MIPSEAVSRSVERLALFVGVSVTMLMAFVVVAPFFVTVPEPALRLIDQNQTSMWNIFLILMSFLFGTSMGKRLAEHTINTQAQNIAAAQGALAPLGGESPTILLPGDQAVVEPQEDGATIIKKEPAP